MRRQQPVEPPSPPDYMYKAQIYNTIQNYQLYQPLNSSSSRHNPHNSFLSCQTNENQRNYLNLNPQGSILHQPKHVRNSSMIEMANHKVVNGHGTVAEPKRKGSEIKQGSILDPPPVPPPSALLLFHQTQTQNEKQENHVYPGSSMDIDESKYRQRFIEESENDKINVSNMRKENNGAGNRIQTSLKVENVEIPDAMSSGLITNVQGKNIYRSETKKSSKNIITTNYTTAKLSKELKQSLNFKTSFENTYTETPAIPNITYKFSTL